jgi:NADH dehydrogenase [ubiquinone] 1 alpha subcomplex assembly factor 5
MTSSPTIFNMSRKLGFAKRAKKSFKNHDFLYQWVAKDIGERLLLIKRDFQSVLLSGAYTANYFQDRFKGATLSEYTTPESLMDQAGQYDCILSMGELHTANDLPGLLIQFRRALKPDGVFIAAFAGGESLYELRAALMQAEMDVTGGASPRVYPFIDKQQMSALMQRAGFSLPVVDSEILTISYRDMFHVISDIRGMGESNGLTDCHKNFSSSKLFFEAAKLYQNSYQEHDGRVSATYEIIFVIGWAPHDSQQKPAKRGSGQVSLSEILS